MKPASSAHHGFTLIELLVVVSVIAVLAAMLLPAIGLVRDQARSIACANNLRQIGLGIQGYATDQEGILPLSLFESTCVPAEWGYSPTAAGSWADPPAVGAFLDSPPISGGVFPGLAQRRGALVCPLDKRRSGIDDTIGIFGVLSISYGLNAALCPYVNQAYDATQRAAAWAARKPLSSLRVPASLMLATDTKEPRWYFPAFNVSAPNPATMVTASQDVPQAWNTTDAPNLPRTRHRGGVNLLFADGHAAFTPSLVTAVTSRQYYARVTDAP